MFLFSDCNFTKNEKENKSIGMGECGMLDDRRAKLQKPRLRAVKRQA
jgi:hypothetical protein